MVKNGNDNYRGIEEKKVEHKRRDSEIWEIEESIGTAVEREKGKRSKYSNHMESRATYPIQH